MKIAMLWDWLFWTKWMLQP